MTRARPIYLFTDFGWNGPYVGQMVAAVQAVDPAIPITSLMHDAPKMRPELAAYLLRACCRTLPRGAVVVAVVDPGVGGERAALVVETASQTFVGPDNGLLSQLASIERVDEIDWRPEQLSTSFHGRDLFAPAAARLAIEENLDTSVRPHETMVGFDWPYNRPEVVYIDDFGNLMIGVEVEKVHKNSVLSVSGRDIAYAETFGRVGVGDLFWYRNSQGLVEIAANSRSAADLLALALGDAILIN